MRAFSMDDLNAMPAPEAGPELSTHGDFSVWDAYAKLAEYTHLLECELAALHRQQASEQAYRVGWRTFVGTLLVGAGTFGLVQASLQLWGSPLGEAVLTGASLW
jgi:hypothetical protein